MRSIQLHLMACTCAVAAGPAQAQDVDYVVEHPSQCVLGAGEGRDPFSPGLVSYDVPDVFASTLSDFLQDGRTDGDPIDLRFSLADCTIRANGDGEFVVAHVEGHSSDYCEHLECRYLPPERAYELFDAVLRSGILEPQLVAVHGSENVVTCGAGIPPHIELHVGRLSFRHRAFTDSSSYLSWLLMEWAIGNFCGPEGWTPSPEQPCSVRVFDEAEAHVCPGLDDRQPPRPDQ